MTPLDLSTKPPRSCHVEIEGIMFLARAIDKVRAELPGGNLGDYITLKPDIQTVSALFYRRFNVTASDFTIAVAGAGSDEEISVWLRSNAAPEIPAKWNAFLLRTRIADLPDDGRAALLRNNPLAQTLAADTLLIDALDAEDAAAFGA